VGGDDFYAELLHIHIQFTYQQDMIMNSEIIIRKSHI